MPDLLPITTVICAYNAEATIERAVRSALLAGNCPILLVDDHSTDSTVERAQMAAGGRLKVVKPREKIGIGNARQTAVETLETPFGLWLDADDEMLPGRSERMFRTLMDTNSDLAYDAGLLITENEQEIPLPMPAFLRQGDGYLRLLERNWLPGLWGGFRTEFAKQIEYDRTFMNSEDYDFLLRSLFAGARVQLETECGYRYYHSDTSLSRNLSQAVNYTGAAVAKFTPADYEARLSRSGLPEGEQLYTLAAAHLMSGRYGEAIRVAASDGHSPALIAPYDQSSDRLLAYVAGTAHLKKGSPETALSAFESFQAETSEQYNNKGVALKLTGDLAGAAKSFEQALALKAGYIDAIRNLKGLSDPAQNHITLLPMRPIADRSDYKV